MIEGVEVPEGWRRVRLGEVAHSLKSGGTPLRDVLDFWGGNVPFVLIEDMTKTNKYLISTNETISEKGLKNSSAWIVPKYSILLSMYASLGEVVINKIDVATNQAILGIILKKDYNLEFMYYILRFNKRNYEKYTIQTTQKNLNKELVSQIFICIPISLPEQHKIADILETVDNTIERTNKIIEKYKRIKQGLMQDLLTRGVVENDELGVMSYELRDEEKHRFKDSPLGRIPEEWEVVELMNGIGGNANLIVAGPFGSNLKVEDYKKTGIPIIRLQNIDENKFIDKDIKFIADKKAKELSYHSFISGDLILAKLGDPIGKTCIVPNNFEYGIVVADVVRIRVNEQYADKRFISYILNFDICRNQLNTDIIGTTRPRVNLDQIRTAKIPLPPLSEQHIIASILSQTDETIEKEQKYKQKLESIKQGLMDDLLTGKVRVNHLINEGMENVQPA
ncbi:Type-1 restriction enzyme MjaXIP specificity protein [ANME-1 cluster archaeon GoMg2]|nr:Type-1 restriction enzyme MjaXIP specificity protein [ANME-1 cluster archaeon GoMg2]